jgi:nicotinamide-nucleotide amidase
LDTNSQWLSQQLGQLGVNVRYHTTVGDELPWLSEALEVALRRAPLVVITGGLGPTADDLTRQALAEATGQPLQLRAEILQLIEARFAHRGHPMPAQNRVQALFPRGSQVIPNPHGTAPGIDMDVATPGGRCRLFALPGVPAEMREMWCESVAPAVRRLAGARQVICHHRVKCFGTGESQLEAMLPDLIRRDREPRVGITVHGATITLRVTASGPDEAACRLLMQPTLETIHACLGDLVFGQEDDELEHAVLRLLERRQQRLVVGEWGTAGLIGSWLSAADTSGRLQAALIASQLQAWQGLFSSVPAASDQEALMRWVAENLRERFGSQYALLTGPLPSPQDDDPRILLALAGPRETAVVERGYRGHPDVVLQRAAKQALDLLRLELLRAANATKPA